MSYSKLNMTLEEKSLIETFNNTYAPYDAKTKLVDVIERQASLTPDKLALVGEGFSLSYRELNERANRLGHMLRQKGIGTDKLVAVLADRSAEMMVAIYGILKAGGAYLPIDPTYPQGRIDYLLSDSQAQVVLAQNHHIDKINGSVEVFDLDAERTYATDYSNLEPIGSSSDMAYVIYTSGSTGNPKGVMIEHHSVINRIQWMQKAYPIYQDDVILQKTPISFDVSVWELFWWAFEGATCCLLKPRGEKDPDAVVDAIERYGVTTMHFVPSMLTVFLDTLEMTENADRLRSLRQVFASGEALGVRQVQRFNNLLHETTGAKLINLYGPTEATVDVTYFPCSEGLPIERTVPIGKPIDNTRLYVVDEQMNVLPVGTPGELCIAGVGLARGYLNREELTKEKFVDHPFVGESRIYRTGDLCAWMPNGNIEYLGRIDHQVKIRGYRIELGEVEEALLKQPEIRDAVVVARSGADEQKYLCGYIIASQTVTEETLKKRLGVDLPEFMVPSRVVLMEKFPLSPNGKLDRKLLPEPEPLQSERVAYVAPRSDVEKRLVQLWEQVLGVDNVSVHDHFFHLGGQSLLVTTMKMLINKQMNVYLPFEAMFQHPTVAELASYIEQLEQTAAFQPIPKAEERSHYPMSIMQKQMFILSQMDKEGIQYNIPFAFHVQGQVDLDRLEQAFCTLIERHEILRTSFDLKDGELVQTVLPRVDFKLVVSEGKRTEIEAKTHEFLRPFDLAEPPLLRVEWVHLEPGNALLLVDIHHIISDGESTSLLLEEVSRLYAEEPLNPVRVQYRDFVQWHETHGTGQREEEQEKFWLEQFDGELPILELMTDRIRPKTKQFKGRKKVFRVGQEGRDQLLNLARKHNATLYMTILTAYGVLLHKYTGQNDVIIGSPFANRAHPDLETALGMFVNTMPIRLHIDPERTFGEQVETVSREVVTVFEHQGYPFEKLVEKLAVERDPSRNPIFDAVFVLQNMDLRKLQLTGLDVTPLPLDSGVAKFDLTLQASDLGDELLFELEYDTHLFEEDTMDRLVQHFLILVDEIL